MRKNLFLWIIIFMFLVVPFFNKGIQLATDFMWFNELHLSSVFTKILITQILCGIAGFVIAATLLIANIFIAEKLSSGKVFIPTSMVAYEFFTRLSKFSKRFFLLISSLIALFTGVWASGLWEVYLKFKNSIPFGVKDPLFSNDIGFYVFQLPFLRSVYYGVLALLVLSFVTSLLIYIIRGGIYIGSLPPSIPRKPRIHLLFLAGTIIGLLYFHFDFALLSMITKGGSILNGAGYADIHFEIPVLRFLMVASVVVGIVIWVTIGLRSLIPALVGIVALVVLLFVGSGGNQLLQKLIVAPNELSKESPYIKWSISGTRSAYNLDKIEEKGFSPSEDLSKDIIEENSATLKNIRLWDHAPLKTTFSQLQEIRTYYEFLDVDNDRYMINGELRQVMLSPRELVPSSLPSRIWINERLSYTHGYGLCLGPVNQVTKEGLPEFFIKNIPPVSTVSIEVKKPEIYFGEADAGYAIVNTAAKEFDFPSGDQNVYSQYNGTGGVKIGNLFKRLLFVAQFKEPKILLSTDIKADSRIMMYRQILDRVGHAAPFFKYDRDPYMVITNDGRMVWVIDGYTTTNAYPYSLNTGSSNYIRNSVKVVIDAYNGDLKFYLSDPSDPICKTYAAMFPGLILPLDQMPADIRAHLRYPQTMFALQARVFSLYHMTDPQVFYNKEDLWKVPNVLQTGSETVMPPYYTIMKLAEVGVKEEFILMVPFTPAKKDNMIAWLAARCDGDDYGKLLVFNFPKQKLVYGPQQIDNRINQDPEISRQLSLWNQGGSRVIRGSLLVIPVSQSLLFVQPLYIEAQGGGLPELKRVIVAYGNTIAMEENLDLSLGKIFGTIKKTDTRDTVSGEKTINSITSTVKELIAQAQNEYTIGRKALSEGNLGAYGEAMNRVRDIITKIAKQVK
jgi:uncharacterized membrane protein (UPF0182 family)